MARAIECIWTSEGDPDGVARERVAPSTGMSIVINLGGDPGTVYRDEHDRNGLVFRESTVWGPETTYVIRNASRRGNVIGVHFRPGMGASILGLPAHELTGRRVALEDLWGARARQLRQ